MLTAFKFLLALSLSTSTAFAAVGHRLGLGISVPLGISVVYDRAAFFTEHLSIGGELTGIADHDYVYTGARLIYWQHGEVLTGFYGGAKAGLAFGDKFGAAVGAEGGWQYRFENNIDVGAGAELWVSHDTYGGIRLNAGYLF